MARRYPSRLQYSKIVSMRPIEATLKGATPCAGLTGPGLAQIFAIMHLILIGVALRKEALKRDPAQREDMAPRLHLGLFVHPALLALPDRIGPDHMGEGRRIFRTPFARMGRRALPGRIGSARRRRIGDIRRPSRGCDSAPK